MLKFKLLFFISLLFYSACMFSQDQSNVLNLKGKRSLSFSMGFTSNSSTVVYDGGYTGRVNSDPYSNSTLVNAQTGFIGSFSFMHWFENEWAINFQVGVLNAKADVAASNVSTNSIMPVLFGFKYYPAALSLGSVGRVYAGLNMGAYVGVSTNTAFWVFNQTTIETVFGIQPNAGVDMFVTDWLRIGPSLSYDIFGNFHDIAINNDKTFGFSVNFGVVF